MAAVGMPIFRDDRAGELAVSARRLFGAGGGMSLLDGSSMNAEPFAFVISANIHRRHLTGEQRRDLIAKLLKAEPERSDRQIAGQVKVDGKTVAKVRHELERRAEIPHVATRTDRIGRQQPPKEKRERAKAKVEPKPTNGVSRKELEKT
jgi:hypothetical protein